MSVFMVERLHDGGNVSVYLLDNGRFGVGHIYDTGEFCGRQFDELSDAEIVYEAKMRAIGSYMNQFGTRGE